MNIKLDEATIRIAITEYIQRQGIDTTNKHIDITLKMGRKGNGLSTSVNITDAVEGNKQAALAETEEVEAAVIETEVEPEEGNTVIDTMVETDDGTEVVESETETVEAENDIVEVASDSEEAPTAERSLFNESSDSVETDEL